VTSCPFVTTKSLEYVRTSCCRIIPLVRLAIGSPRILAQTMAEQYKNVVKRIAGQEFAHGV